MPTLFEEGNPVFIPEQFNPMDWDIKIEFNHKLITMTIGHEEDGPKTFPNNKEAFNKILIYAIRRLSEELERRNR